MALIGAIVSIVYIHLLHHINSQQGIGCMWQTCPTPGQVRINAIFDAYGNYMGGCNCGCDPSLGDPSSSKFCAPPASVNYDHNTLQGDCSCILPPQAVTQPPQTVRTTTTQPPHTTFVDPHGNGAPHTTAGGHGAPVDTHEPTELPKPTYPTGPYGIPIHYLNPPPDILTQYGQYPNQYQRPGYTYPTH
eukprot:68165_1